MELSGLLILLTALSGFSCLCGILTLILVARGKGGSKAARGQEELYEEFRLFKEELRGELRASRQEQSQSVARSVNALGQALLTAQNRSSQEGALRQDSLRQSVAELTRNLEVRFQGFAQQNQQSLEQMRQENARQLGQIRATVDEKLEKTLETRLNQSFRLVSERLEQVYKGLGEMQTLASGVGDLKRVLSNVKTRGILGEVQLGAILEQILAPEQYKANVATKAGSRNVVEFAVVLPGEGDQPVYLPIDAKFPADAYTQLQDAQAAGDPAAVAAASNQLASRLKSFAKDIHDKYIDPPGTTEFGVMFLPFEGLYAEALRLGLMEPLMGDYQVTLAGPTTLAALLNSLRMGFRTLAIQKRSSQVWEILGAVKTEFDRFGDALSATQQRLEQANHELDKLVGVRTRMIQRSLRQVSALSQEQAVKLLEGELPKSSWEEDLEARERL